MEKLSQFFNKIKEKFKGLSKGKKMAYSILAVGIISSLIFLVAYLNKTNYAVLFSDMDINDAQVVMNSLNEKKIDYIVENNTIKIPEEAVSALRLELAPQLTSGSKGWELFDEGSSFGTTDKEMNIKYQRALQGELERNIKSLPEVENTDVRLVLPDQSNFFKDTEPAQASITLYLRYGKKLDKSQIKAVASLVTGSVKNLPKENVEIIGVINGTTELLSENLYDDNDEDLTIDVEKNQSIKRKYEKELEQKIINILKPTKYGRDARVAVNAELDFDALEKTSVKWDPDTVITSEQTVKTNNVSSDGDSSTSPIDNNMSNAYTNDSGTVSSHEERTVNYEVGKTEEKVVKALGKINRISASVVVNNPNISEGEKAKIKNLIYSAIGYDQLRGDSISVEGMEFGTNTNNSNLDLNNVKDNEQDNNKLYKYLGIGASALAILLIIFIIIKRNKKKDKEVEEQLNVTLAENVQPKEELEPIVFEENNEINHVANEVKKYAKDKPEQVIEVIKAWMAEDEG